MFTSDGIYSGSCENDISEGHVDQPPEGQDGTDRGTKERQFEDCVKELGFPRNTLERAVTQLKKELDDCRTEFEITRKQTPAPAGNRRQLSQARFTSTPVPRYSGKSNWEQYREIFEAIVCSNGWDDVTAALQLLSHLDEDALNVTLLVPESQRTVPEFLINSLSDHYNSPGRRAEYKRQFQRVARQPGDDPSIFTIELETLARREFMDVDLKIQLQMVRDRFIDGQADRSLRRHLDSLGANSPMIEMADSCRIWERHCEPEIRPRMSTDRGPIHVTAQVSEEGPTPAIPPEMESAEDTIRRLLPTPAPPPLQAAPKYTDRDILVRQLMETICPEDRPIPAIPSEMESVEDMIRRLLPTPAPPPLQAAPKYTDRDTIVQQLMETICPEDRPTLAIPSEMESVDHMIRRLLPTPATPPLQAAPKYTDRDILVQQLRETICPTMLVAQKGQPTNDWETPSFNQFPVRTVTEEVSTEGCFSCGKWTHNTEECQALDESFPFLRQCL